MFAYSFIKLSETFDPGNDQKGLTFADIHCLNSVKGKLSMAINHLSHFCFQRIINWLLQSHNFITISG